MDPPREPKWVFRRVELAASGLYDEVSGCKDGYCLLQRDRVNAHGRMSKMFAVYSNAQYAHQMSMSEDETDAANTMLDRNISRGVMRGYSSNLYYGFHKTPSIMVLDMEYSNSSVEGKRLRDLFSCATIPPGGVAEINDMTVAFKEDIKTVVSIVVNGMRRSGYSDPAFSVHLSTGLKPSAHIHFHSVLFADDRQKYSWLRAVCGNDLDLHPRASAVVDWVTLNRVSGAMRIPGFAKAGTTRVLVRSPWLCDSLDTKVKCEQHAMFLYPWATAEHARPVAPIVDRPKPRTAPAVDVVVQSTVPVDLSTPAVLILWIQSVLPGIRVDEVLVSSSTLMYVNHTGYQCPNATKSMKPHRNRLCVYITHKKGLQMSCCAPSCSVIGKSWKSDAIRPPSEVTAAIVAWFPDWGKLFDVRGIDTGDDFLADIRDGKLLTPTPAWDLEGVACRKLVDDIRVITHPDGQELLPFFGDDLLGMGTDRSTLIVEAAKGFGKTKKLVECIKSRFSGKDVLFITNRRILATNLHSRLSELGSSIYTDDCWKNAAGIVIFQLDSIWKIPEDRVFDLVVLDEVSTTFPHMEFKCMKKAPLVWTSFFNVCRRASKLIALDAFITPRETNILSLIRGAHNTTLRVYKSRPAASKTRYVYQEDKDLFLDQIVAELVSGKNVFVATLSRAFGERVCEEYTRAIGDKNYMMYSALTRDDVKKDHFSNVETHWSKFRLVVITPTCNAGISYEIPGYFHSVWLYACRGSASPGTLLQMGARVRDIRDNLVVFTFDCMSFIPSSMSTLLASDVGRKSILSRLCRTSGKSVGDALSAREELKLYNTRESELSRLSFPNVFASLLLHMGVTSVSKVGGKGKKRGALQQEPMSIDATTYNIHSKSVSEAAVLTPVQCDSLRRTRESGGFISDFDASCIVKSSLFSHFGEDLPQKALDYVCKSGCKNMSDFMWKWTNFKHLLRSRSVNPFVYTKPHDGKRRRLTDRDSLGIAESASFYAHMIDLTPDKFRVGSSVTVTTFVSRWETTESRDHFDRHVAHMAHSWSYYEEATDGESRNITARRVGVCAMALGRYGFVAKLGPKRQKGEQRVVVTPVFVDVGMQSIVDSISTDSAPCAAPCFTLPAHK